MCFYLLSNFLYSTGGPPQTLQGLGKLPPTFPFDGLGALIMRLKNYLRALIRFLKLTLRQL